MTERVIDIAGAPARLRLDQERLVIAVPDETPLFVPISEIATLILANPQISLSQPVLSALARAGAAVVVSDDRRMPAAMLLPLDHHSTQTARMAAQVSAAKPVNKRLWREIVREKIRAQGRALRELRGADGGLPLLASRVRSGDPANLEAQASIRYWKLLFDDRRFRRERSAEDQNRLLNYGYAVLRAVVARALCGAGLHPSFGIHHRNQYNAFCLADDLMEPFRPVVDRAVVALVDRVGPSAALDSGAKATLIGAITGRYEVGGERRSLFDLASRASSALAGVYLGQRKTLSLAVP